jgi:hypothetical protein
MDDSWKISLKEGKEDKIKVKIKSSLLKSLILDNGCVNFKLMRFNYLIRMILRKVHVGLY